MLNCDFVTLDCLLRPLKKGFLLQNTFISKLVERVEHQDIKVIQRSIKYIRSIREK